MILEGCKITSFSDEQGAWGDVLGFGSVACAWLNWDTWAEGGRCWPAYERGTRIRAWFMHEGKLMRYWGVIQDYGKGHVVGAGQVEPWRWFDLWLPESFQVLDLEGRVEVIGK